MLNGVSPQPQSTTASLASNKSFINKKVIVLIALGGASFAAIWMYRKKINNHLNLQQHQKKSNRRMSSDQINMSGETNSNEKETTTNFVDNSQTVEEENNKSEQQQKQQQNSKIDEMQQNSFGEDPSSSEGKNSDETINQQDSTEGVCEFEAEQFSGEKDEKATAAAAMSSGRHPDTPAIVVVASENDLVGCNSNSTYCYSSSSLAHRQNLSTDEQFVHSQNNNTLPEFDWASLIVEDEKKTQNKDREGEKDQKKYLHQKETKQWNCAAENMQEQQITRSNSLYMGRMSSSSGRQHPVNSICMCSRCLEQLNDLRSSREYKNAESPHSTYSEGSADSGRATGPLTSYSPFVDEFGQTEFLPIYEFEVPNTLVGLIIGIKGKTIRELCIRADVRMLIRPHHTQNKYETHQICSVEGRRENINKCLHMIRLRFPPCRFSDLNLKPVLPPPPATTSAGTLRGVPSALALTIGVPSEVYISANVSAGHLFIQLPTHQSFASLTVLDQYMLSVYTQPGGAPDLPKPCNVGVLCAAPAYNGWFRAITLAYEEEQDETLVRFVDYGGFARLPRADLRQIRTDFMTLPMQSIECYLANVQPAEANGQWHEKANELFQQLCVSKVIQAALVGYCKDDGIPFVELYVLDENKKSIRVDQILMERGFAKPADPSIMVQSAITA